jgi:hypothetical protein
MLQAQLRNKGYGIAVDGNYGKQTEDALGRYIADANRATETKVQEATRNANPAFIRSGTNAVLAKNNVADARKNVADQARQQLVQINYALQQKRNGDPKFAKVDAAQLAQQKQSWEAMSKGALDPINGYDNATIADINGRLNKYNQENPQVISQKGSGGTSWTSGQQYAPEKIIGASFAGGMQLIDDVFNRGAAALAAGFTTSMHGGNVLQQVQAEVGSLTSWIRVPGTDLSLVGLVAPGGSEARKQIEATNTIAERQALVEKGDLLSLGQVLTNRVTPQFHEQHPGWSNSWLNVGSLVNSSPADLLNPSKWKNGGIASPDANRPSVIQGQHDVLSGLADVATIPVKDPTIFLGKAFIDPLTEIGTHIGEQALKAAGQEAVDALGEDTIMQFGRRNFLDQDAVGRRLANDVGLGVRDLNRTGNLSGMLKAFKGLPEETARLAMEARTAATGGIEEANAAAHRVIMDAFVTGKWNPSVGVLRQMGIRFDARLGLGLESQIGRDTLALTEEGLGIGGKAVQLQDRLDFFRHLAAPRGDTATAFETKAGAFLDQSLDTATLVGNSTASSVWKDHVAPRIAGLDISERFYRVADYIYGTESPQFIRAFDGLIRPFFNNADLLRDVPVGSYMEAVLQQDGFEQAVRKLESAMAVSTGQLGSKAASQFGADLARGFLLPKNWERQVVAQAAQGVGIKLGKGVENATLKSVRKAIAQLPDELRGHFEDRLTALGEKGNIGLLQRDVEAVLGSSDMRDEVARILEQTKTHEAGLLTAPAREGALTRGLRKIPRGVTNIAEVVAPAELRFQQGANAAAHARLRGRAMERLLGDYNVPMATRLSLVGAAERVQTEEELFGLAERALRAGLEAKGIDNPTSVISILRERGDFVVNRALQPVRMIDPTTGEMVSDLQTLAQRIESVKVPSADEVATAIRKAILDGAQDSDLASKLSAKLRVYADSLGTIRITSGGKTLAMRVHQAHQLWKWMVVTNATMPLIGAAAGFIGTHGSLTDRLRGAGVGLALGSVGMARSVFRITLLESRMRMMLAEGFNPDMIIPGYAGAFARRYGEDPYRRFLSWDLTRIGGGEGQFFDNELLTHTNREWEAVSRDSSYAPEAWWRIHNFQLHPESDPVTAVLLREKAGHIGTKEADKLIAEFLDTEEGALWKKRWKGAYGGAKTAKKAVARMREFINTYSTEELAAQRVAGGVNGLPAQIDRTTIKRMLESGAGPDAFHAQKAWKFPKSAGDVYRTYHDTASWAVLSGPENAVNRRPMTNALFGKEYDRLIRNGVEPAEAQTIADSVARERTNSILHRFDEPSRFSAKVDPWAPFQHAKADILRVYGKIVLENPVRTMRIVAHGALLMNAGVQNGMFAKNDATGQWEISIPGSGRLSQSLFGMPMSVPFTAPVKDLFFVTNSAYSLGGNAIPGIPTPGGPMWSVFASVMYDHLPELFHGDNPIHNYLFPYGPNGNLLRKDNSLLWMGMTGSTPPWEFEKQESWKNELNHWQDEVGRELMYQRRLKGDTSVPTQEEVDSATGKFFKAWAFFYSTFPSQSYPVLTSREKYNAAYNAFTLGGRLPFDNQAFLDKYPEFEAYMPGNGVTKYVGPDDLASLKKLGEGEEYNQFTRWDPDKNKWVPLREGAASAADDAGANYSMETRNGQRRYLNWSEWSTQFNTYKRTGDYFRELSNAGKTPDPLQREYNIVNVNKKYADIAQSEQRRNELIKELAVIDKTYPKGVKDQALQRVRIQYGASNLEIKKLQLKVDDPQYTVNPWATARQGFEIENDIRQRLGSGYNDATAAKAVAVLAPAEQVHYWQHMMDATGFAPATDDAAMVLKKYKYYTSQYFAARNAYPFLYRQKDYLAGWKNPFTEIVKGTKENLNTQMTAAFSVVDNLNNEISAAYASKNYKAVDALTNQRTDVYDHISALRDTLFHSTTDLATYYDDLHAAAVYDSVGNKADADRMLRQAQIDKADAPLYLTSEEQRFLHMPDSVKQAYVKDLVDHLDMPAGKVPTDIRKYVKQTYGAGKLFWEWLSPIKQQILEANYPQLAERWKYESDYYLHGPGEHNQKYKQNTAEIDAIAGLLRAYDKRIDPKTGKAIQPPAAYQELLDLPNNAAVKADFLRKHPEVADYIKKGALANMPTLYRELALGTLIKYAEPGKGTKGFTFHRFFHGRGHSHFNPNAFAQSGNFHNVRFSQKPINLQWAIEQLKVWSRRGDATKPAAYDLWVNMPTGRDKATYLQSHPEVQDWIRMGPMQSMPEEYKAVVRDIMARYGEWTVQQDPLGQTITQYFALPPQGRDQFLLNHPELEVYWSLTRTPQAQAMFDLQNTYFQIQDVNAKKGFLEAHPELQQHFVEARTQRYERFLNQVAVFMGANPAMFQDYLNRQEQTLTELLQKFAEPVMIRETGPTDVQAATPTGEAGRTRRPRAQTARQP